MKIFLLLPSVVLGLLQARQSAAFAPPVSLRNPSIVEKPFDPPSPSGIHHLFALQEATPNIRKHGATALQALPTALSALPLSQKIVLSCLLPSCLGFWKTEYGVSYAYGSATALTSWLIYKELIQGGNSLIGALHAGSLVFYGIRLCAFLAYRQATSKRIKEIQKRIEEKSQSRGGRAQRAPFVLSVAALYFGLCAPLLVSSRVSTAPTWATKVLKGLVATTWGGFVFAALGDLNKTLVKTIKGEDHLVTGGIFGFCRHPNYTGEIVGWTSNGLIAVVAAIASQGAGLSGPQLVGYIVASVLGALGLDFVLVGATKGLEKKQKEKYGGTEEYEKWVDSSWCGFELPWSDAADEVVDPSHVTPEIHFEDTSDEGGSGI